MKRGEKSESESLAVHRDDWQEPGQVPHGNIHAGLVY